MWIASTLGFYSIVQKAPDEFHVRGRCRDDLTRLRNAAGVIHRSSLPLVKKSHPGSDYPWRLIIKSPRQLNAIFDALSETIDYPNFKGEIAESVHQFDKLGAYHEMWHSMRVWEQVKAQS